MHQVLSAQPEPVALDQLRDVYSRQLGHKCSIERFLVVNETGLAATLKRIPHVVTVVVEGGATLVKAALPADCTKEKLIEEDKKYRENLMKKNAAAKAKAVSKAGAPAAAGEKRPADAAAAGDAKRAKGDGATEAETLARMLVQGVVRVLQHRVKDGKGPLPLSELEKEFQALWKVPFNLTQAGEKDVVTFFQKWPNKVEVTEEGGVAMVQLSKKADAKGKAAAPAKSPAAAAPPAAAAAVKAAAPASAAAEASKSLSPTPAKAAALRPTRPPSCMEDFLWNLHSVLEAHGEPLPLDQLKDVYSSKLGHKCVVERFLVVNENGLAATLKRIPHVVTVFEEGEVTFVKHTLPAGTTKESLIQKDGEYRKMLSEMAQAKAGAASPPPAKRPAEAAAEGAAAGEAKKPKGEDAETLARMLVQGVVRVLQNRQKEGKGPLPLSSLEEEFKALWKVPFNLQQAGESDAVTFLAKWPNKVELLGEGATAAVALAKKGGDKAKATAAKAGAAVAKAPAAAPEATSPQASPTSPVAAKEGAAVAASAAAATAAAAAVVAAPGVPPVVRQSAESLLEAVQAMREDMERHQQVLAERCQALAEALAQPSP